MATVAIRKKSLYTWEHFYDGRPVYVTNVFNINNGGNETFNIVEYRGAKLDSVPIANVTVYDDTGAGTPETFATFSELNTRLGQLHYPPFRTNGDPSTVESVQQGDGIEVDSTDVNNPVVSIRVSSDIGNNITIGTDGGIYSTGGGGGSGITEVIEKVFTVSLAMIGASDITDVDDVRTKLRAYTIAEGLTKPADETHNWEVVESLTPTIPTLIFITDDLSAFATSVGVSDVNDVAQWNGLSVGSDTLDNADFTDVDIDGNTVTLSGGTGALDIAVLIGRTNLISFACYNLEALLEVNFIACGLTSIVEIVNCPLINGLQLDSNALTVAGFDTILPWATDEATTAGTINIASNAEDLTTSDTYDMLVTTKSWTT